MEENGYQIAAPPYEIYVTDPAVIKSPDDTVTEIYFPIKK
jgi:effector-binding domain-containing protein